MRSGGAAYHGGLAAEEIALRLYPGARVLATRWRRAEGEIDLILEEAGVTVFVEVKSSRDPTRAAHALGPRQRARIVAAAGRWLAESGWRGDCRFDVALVDGQGRAERIVNAFGVEG